MTKEKFSIEKATYTKDSGEVSDRQLIVMSKPNEHVMAIDVSKLDDHAQLALSGFIKQQKLDFDAKLKELGGEWKQFKPNGLVFKA